MRQRFAAIFAERTRDEWVAAAMGCDACLAPVLSIDEAPSHPQMTARSAYAVFDGLRHPTAGSTLLAYTFRAQPDAADAGARQRAALVDWGIAPDEIDRLLAAGALAEA
jgi:alpha-methylacyl-CoA racemase